MKRPLMMIVALTICLVATGTSLAGGHRHRGCDRDSGFHFGLSIGGGYHYGYQGRSSWRGDYSYRMIEKYGVPVRYSSNTYKRLYCDHSVVFAPQPLVSSVRVPRAVVVPAAPVYFEDSVYVESPPQTSTTIIQLYLVDD